MHLVLFLMREIAPKIFPKVWTGESRPDL